MGILDKVFDRDDEDREKKKADFSGVQTGGSTAPSATPRGTAPSGTTPAGSLERERSYTVVAGDSLSKIAQREYGDASKWRRIYEANKSSIKDPDLIHPGQTFVIPDA